MLMLLEGQQILRNFSLLVKDKTKSETKLTNLFIHKLEARESNCHHLSLAGFQRLRKEIAF